MLCFHSFPVSVFFPLSLYCNSFFQPKPNSFPLFRFFNFNLSLSLDTDIETLSGLVLVSSGFSLSFIFLLLYFFQSQSIFVHFFNFFILLCLYFSCNFGIFLSHSLSIPVYLTLPLCFSCSILLVSSLPQSRYSYLVISSIILSVSHEVRFSNRHAERRPFFISRVIRRGSPRDAPTFSTGLAQIVAGITHVAAAA